jgi:hypothetical protein
MKWLLANERKERCRADKSAGAINRPLWPIRLVDGLQTIHIPLCMRFFYCYHFTAG